MRLHIPKCIYILFILSFISGQVPVYALPAGESVASGNATFDYSAADELHIHQTTDQLITNFDSFSINTPELVQFHQPGVSSTALNRVVGADPTLILGRMQANGQVFLVNPNGVVFGAGSQVNVSGLIVSTLDIDNQDFLDRNYVFSGGSGASVINMGKLSAPGGFVALLGAHVNNAGMISAELGTVALASGEAIVLQMDPLGLINVVIEDSVVSADAPAGAGVMNQGTIVANGGRVLLTADVLDSVFDQAINNEGIIEARDLLDRDGQIVLTGRQDVLVAGRIKGGDVEIVSLDADVVHLPNGRVSTKDGTLRGFAGHDYVIGEGSQILTGNGVIDVYAENNILIGKESTDVMTHYAWDYVDDHRGYTLKEIGYYYKDSLGAPVYVPLSIGSDIGKDGASTLSGSGDIYLPAEDMELYMVFQGREDQYVHPADADGLETWTYHTDPSLNGDGHEHIVYDGIRQGWEDIYGLGDQDFDDAEIDFTSEKLSELNPTMIQTSGDMFLTAKKGSIEQTGGLIQADRLVLSTGNGMSGSGPDGSLAVKVNQLAAQNRDGGDIHVSNDGPLTIADLSGLTGLNSGVHGFDGIVNQVLNGAITINTIGEDAHMILDAPVTGRGDITLTSDGNIVHTARGDVTIDDFGAQRAFTLDVDSPSHTPGVWSNNPDIDVTWQYKDETQGTLPVYTAKAAGDVVMAPGSVVETHGGDVYVSADGDVRLSLLDAGMGSVHVTAENGSILDNDLGTSPGDYDVIARKIVLQAPNGSVGLPVPEGEIDIGYPTTFSHLWDFNSGTTPNEQANPFHAELDGDGDWVFATQYTSTQDSDQLWFHVKAIDVPDAVYHGPQHLGPFYIDTTPPVILAGNPQGPQNPDGTYQGDVTVPFSATDNLSGFAPDGDLATDMDSKTGEASVGGLTLTSDGVFDLAGNFAPGIHVGPYYAGGSRDPRSISSDAAMHFDKEFRVYYEILSPNQFVSIEPVSKIGLYAYHPFVEANMDALDEEIQLERKAFEFIEEQIKDGELRTPYLEFD